MAMKTSQKLILIAALILIGAFALRRPTLGERQESSTNTQPEQDAASDANARTPASPPPSSQTGSEPAPTHAVATPVPGRDGNREQALSRLQNESKSQWQPVLESDTGRLRTLEGGLLESPANDGGAGLVQVAQSFVERYAQDLFGVKPENIRYDKIVEMDRSKVIFEQYLDGRRVLGGTLALVYENGALVRVQSDLAPETLPRSSGKDIAIEEAVAFVTMNGGERLAANPERLGNVVRPVASLKPELVYFPRSEKLISAYAIYVDRYNKADERIDRARILVDATVPRILRTDRMTIN